MRRIARVEKSQQWIERQQTDRRSEKQKAEAARDSHNRKGKERKGVILTHDDAQYSGSLSLT